MSDDFVRISPADGADIDQAVAAWSLGWATVLALGYDESDEPLIEMRMVDDWEAGPPMMVAWLKSKRRVEKT